MKKSNNIIVSNNNVGIELFLESPTHLDDSQYINIFIIYNILYNEDFYP